MWVTKQRSYWIHVLCRTAAEVSPEGSLFVRFTFAMNRNQNEPTLLLKLLVGRGRRGRGRRDDKGPISVAKGVSGS